MTCQTFTGRDVHGLVAALYLPKHLTFKILRPRLHFWIQPSDCTNATRDSTRLDYAQVFLRGMLSWLKGKGHPDHPRLHDWDDVTGLTPAKVAAERNNPHLRPQMLLFAALNRKQPPFDEAWSISVSACSAPPCINADILHSVPLMRPSHANHTR